MIVMHRPKAVALRQCVDGGGVNNSTTLEPRHTLEPCDALSVLDQGQKSA